MGSVKYHNATNGDPAPATGTGPTITGSRPRISTPGPDASGVCLLQADQPLRLLTYNMQVGIETARYRHYVTRGWRHVLPCTRREDNLRRLAALLGEYDIIALQEADAGSVRSMHVNQVEFLAREAGFPWWYAQINRQLGRFARHSLGLLSRIEPREITEHRLPGLPGRGAMNVRFGQTPGEELVVVIAHLALGENARNRQLAYLRGLVAHHDNAVIMGDMNCRGDMLDARLPLNLAGGANNPLATFPSWRPRHDLDHILVSPALQTGNTEVVDYAMSDHLPLASNIILPANAGKLTVVQQGI